MNVRLSILLVVVLILIGGTVGITQVLNTKEPREQEPWFFKLNLDDIRQISVTHVEERVDYAYEGDQWVIKDGNDTPVFIEDWAGTTLLLSGPRSSRALDIEIYDPAEYGFDPPRTKVEIVDKSGSQRVKFDLGDPTPDGENWYARLEGSTRLFTIAASWCEVISELATDPPYPPSEEDEGGSEISDTAGT